MSNELVEQVKLAGVVGAGGAGFPTHVKLAANAEILIANGTECEPMLQSDQHLMATEAEAVLQGMRLGMEATGASEGIIAIKRHYHDAIEAFEALLTGHPDIRIHLFDSFYPAGDEYVVVYDCTGRQVPENGLPIMVGVVVQNVTTLRNIALAAQGVPVTDKLLTVAGEVNRPATLLAPVGTSYAQLVEAAGGLRDERFTGYSAEELALVEGGPMMGRMASPDGVVTKTSGGLLALPSSGPVVTMLSRDEDTTVRRGRSACDQCRDCTDLCPRHLLGHELQPHTVMRAINYAMEEDPRSVTAAILCCECRLCEAFACPLDLSPFRYYVSIKRALREQGWRNEIHKNAELTAHSMREFRRVPTSRLMDRLGLAPYRGQPAPLQARPVQPDEVRIPLQMHIGAPSRPVVTHGDNVKRGQLIAAIPEGALGAAIHASIDGVVTEVGEDFIRIERRA